MDANFQAYTCFINLWMMIATSVQYKMKSMLKQRVYGVAVDTLKFIPWFLSFLDPYHDPEE
jgi:hypothetical protein